MKNIARGAFKQLHSRFIVIFSAALFGLILGFIAIGSGSDSEQEFSTSPFDGLPVNSFDAKLRANDGFDDATLAFWREEITSGPEEDRERAYTQVSIIHINRDESDAALAVLQEAELEGYTSNAILLGLAGIHAQRLENEQAISYYERVIEGLDISDPLYESDKAGFEDAIEDLRRLVPDAQ